MKISTKILLASILLLSLLGTILTALAYNDMKHEQELLLKNISDLAYESKREELKNEVKLVHGVIKTIYDRNLQNGISKEETQKNIKDALNDVRFFDDNSGYIFIYDFNGKNIATPIKPELEGKNLIDLKDANGKFLIKELIEISKKGGGVVSYLWPKAGSDKAELKFSYATKFAPFDWMIGTGVYVDNIEKKLAKEREITNKKISDQITIFMGASLVLITLSIFIIFIVIRKGITLPLNNLIEKTKNLSSGDGDLTKKLEVRGNDELAQASTSINDFIEKVRILIGEAKNLSNENSSIAHELSTTALEVGKLVEESTNIVGNTTQQATTMKGNMSISIDEAKVSKGDLEKANEFLTSANNTILELTEEIKISASIEIELAQKIQQLSSDTDQVKDVLHVIGDIADQTNLLALNAAIEAARAGEHGRGFAVVADEVRKLAERTQKSLIEINSTINVIVQSIVESSEQMSTNSKKVEELSDTASSVEVKINNLATVMSNATMMTDKTVNNYIETGNDISSMIDSVSKINEISTENARSVEEIASAAEHMNKMTEILNNKLSEFRT